MQNPAYTRKLITRDRLAFLKLSFPAPEGVLQIKPGEKMILKKEKTLSCNARMQVVAVASKKSNLLKLQLLCKHSFSSQSQSENFRLN